jgi:hypothetical protein
VTELVPAANRPTRPICEDCRRRVVVDFKVPDEVWLAVFKETHGPGYFCVQCFGARADERLVPWCRDIELFPMSQAEHIASVVMPELARQMEEARG